jgi:hypothetical protein
MSTLPAPNSSKPRRALLMHPPDEVLRCRPVIAVSRLVHRHFTRQEVPDRRRHAVTAATPTLAWCVPTKSGMFLASV